MSSPNPCNAIQEKKIEKAAFERINFKLTHLRAHFGENKFTLDLSVQVVEKRLGGSCEICI